jgi:Xaa-Pro aminopeptidase
MAGILPKTEFETAPAQLVTMRATKDVWEIGCLHNAALNGRAALDAAVGALAPGVSELEVAAEAMAVLVRNGATRPAMPIVAFGENTVHPHHIPTDRCLSAGDVVLLDVYGEAADNYCCDLTETLVWGTADPEAERGIDAVREVQEEIAGKLRKGVTLAQIDAWVGEALDRRALGRYYLGRACHLLGLSEHDPLSEDRGLEEGAVFALEPGVYDLGRRHGVRVERTYLIRQAGAVDLEWRTGTF